MNPVIETVDEHPDEAARDLILDLLNEDNARKASRREGGDFAVLLRDPATGDVVGGLWGIDDFGWAFITYLYVPPILRGRRIGETLMREAEAIARRRGMVGLWLNTFDFQARGFYEKLGYSLFATLESVDDAAGQFFLKKRLPTLS